MRRKQVSTTLGPNKATRPGGAGLRWLKVRHPPVRPGAVVVVSYTIWMQDASGSARGTVSIFLPDNSSRTEAARVLALARRRMREYELNQARAAKVARADVRAALRL